MDPVGLTALQDAIRHMHGCESTWLSSVPVVETFEGATVWDGEVQVFALTGHPTAKRCYAWSIATVGAKRRFFAVLHTSPIDGPVAAVRGAILADAKAQRS
jgi:hypothetical protein